MFLHHERVHKHGDSNDEFLIKKRLSNFICECVTNVTESLKMPVEKQLDYLEPKTFSKIHYVAVVFWISISIN